MLSTGCSSLYGSIVSSVSSAVSISIQRLSDFSLYFHVATHLFTFFITAVWRPWPQSQSLHLFRLWVSEQDIGRLRSNRIVTRLIKSAAGHSHHFKVLLHFFCVLLLFEMNLSIFLECFLTPNSSETAAQTQTAINALPLCTVRAHVRAQACVCAYWHGRVPVFACVCVTMCCVCMCACIDVCVCVQARQFH